MRTWEGFLFSPATANEECSYCSCKLDEVSSLKLTDETTERYICPKCLIRILDDTYIKAIKKKKK